MFGAAALSKALHLPFVPSLRAVSHALTGALEITNGGVSVHGMLRRLAGAETSAVYIMFKHKAKVGLLGV